MAASAEIFQVLENNFFQMREVTIQRATLALITITLGVKLLGFAGKQVIAYYFGADHRVDAFFIAWSIPFALFLLIREIIEPAFLPLFVRLLDTDKRDRANQLFTASAAGILAFTLPATLTIWLAADHLATGLAPGFTPAAHNLTAELLGIMILSAPILGSLLGHRFQPDSKIHSQDMEPTRKYPETRQTQGLLLAGSLRHKFYASFACMTRVRIHK